MGLKAARGIELAPITVILAMPGPPEEAEHTGPSSAG
jgi:hypothetical protein